MYLSGKIKINQYQPMIQYQLQELLQFKVQNCCKTASSCHMRQRLCADFFFSPNNHHYFSPHPNQRCESFDLLIVQTYSSSGVFMGAKRKKKKFHDKCESRKNEIQTIKLFKDLWGSSLSMDKILHAFSRKLLVELTANF